MGGDRGGGGGGGPAPGKLQVIIYFQEEKTGTNFSREAPPSPVGVVWIRTRLCTYLQACKFASVRRSLNLERLSGNKSLVCINAECTLETLTVALTGAADIFVN